MPTRPSLAVPVLLLAVLAGACEGSKPSTGPSGPAGTVSEVRFTSSALGVEKRYFVYLPAGYADSQARYPVVYLLHDLGGDERDWTRLGGVNTVADTLQLQAILVMPDGDDSLYVNSVTPADYDACLSRTRPFGSQEVRTEYCVKQARYEDYIVQDLVASVDARYRTIADRKARALGGVGLGGYGALNLAFHHPDVFASVGAHSPPGSLLYRGPHPYVSGEADVSSDPQELRNDSDFGAYAYTLFGSELDTWRAQDPTVQGPQLASGQLAISFDVGDQDELGVNDSCRYLDDVLNAAHVTHTFTHLDGTHDWGFWSSRIGTGLQFHAAQFKAAGY